MRDKRWWCRPWVRRMAVVAILLHATWWVVPHAVPLPAGLDEPPPESLVLCDRNGVSMARFTLPGSLRAAPVGTDALPPDLVACTVAAEDKRFFAHSGVDLLAIVRAAWDGLRHREFYSGASTITQQLIKVSSPPARRTFGRKAYEAIAAVRLERMWDKDRILTEYLNRIDYGNRRIGVAEAARFYYQKPLADLSLAECAMLAGLPQAPSRMNPLRHPERAMKRRAMVLDRAANAGLAPSERVKLAKAEPAGLRPLQPRPVAPWLGGVTPPEGAEGRTRTTLDAGLQSDAEAIVREEVNRLRDANLRHAAVVVLDNQTGGILALVSSANWNDPRGGQINGTLAPRSPGSALKPFTYLLAIERNRRTPASIVADVPTPFRTPQGVDLPQNYDRTYRGPVTLRDALACSLNVPAMRELNALGGPRDLHLLLTGWGLGTLGEDPEAHGLGLTIGNAPVRLLELAGAYASLARGGVPVRPVLFPGTVELPGPRISNSSCRLVADILSDRDARAPVFPPGGPLDLPFRCAVKTGTSSDFRDNWCIGFTRDITVGVWAGNFENQPMKGISGVDGAAPIFHRVMLRAHRDQVPRWFETPDDWREVWIDPRNGLLVAGDSSVPHRRRDRIPADRLPPVASKADYDRDGRALLGGAYATWFDSPHNLRRGELALSATERSVVPLRILQPVNGAVFLLDPEMPDSGSRLLPQVEPPGVVRWTSGSLRVETRNDASVIHLVPGTHRLTATDTRNGNESEITVHVRSL